VCSFWTVFLQKRKGGSKTDDKENLFTLKLYSPLHADYFSEEKPDWADDGYNPNEPIDLWGEELVSQKDVILDAIESEKLPREAQRGLMEYFYGSQTVNEKVVSLHPTVEEVKGVLYGVAVCKIKRALTPDELAELKSYCAGQYADGWGEGVEQRPRKIYDGELYINFWQSSDFFIKTAKEMGFPEPHMKSQIQQVTNETFWMLISESKINYGQNLNACAEWVQSQLEQMPPEQSLNFHAIFHKYLDMANQYGLWDAASVMCRSCSDDGFIDFRAWLIGQGKETYLAALKNPDSLANVPAYGDCSFEQLCYTADKAFQTLTGKSAFDVPAPKYCNAEVRKAEAEVQFGMEINYPHTWVETAKYIPRLCAKFIPPDEMKTLINGNKSIWFMDNPKIKNARKKSVPQKKNQQQYGGDAR